MRRKRQHVPNFTAGIVPALIALFTDDRESLRYSQTSLRSIISPASRAARREFGGVRGGMESFIVAEAYQDNPLLKKTFLNLSCQDFGPNRHGWAGAIWAVVT